MLRRGLSYGPVDGRLPVDVNAETSLYFSAETCRVSIRNADNRVASCRNVRFGFDYAFSPAVTSANLKGTPHPPIPQYPFGFFARYCWWYSSA